MMSIQNQDEKFFKTVLGEAEEAESTSVSSPCRLKARIYSALIQRQLHSGPLLSVTKTKAGSRHLYIFENLVAISRVGEQVKSLNFCSVCHARIIAEKMENAPIYWSHCPYVRFEKR